jgi:replication factor C small subunit
MIERLKTIANEEKIEIDNDVFEIITEICEGDARRSINTLQNIKYIPGSKNKKITKLDIYNITSYMDKTYFDDVWNKILTTSVNELSNMAVEITNTGYPMNYILECIENKVIESTMTQTQKSKILMYIGKVERMITYGSDNYIQLLAVLSYLNGINKQLNIINPSIY